jgi:hypothetical protein
MRAFTTALSLVVIIVFIWLITYYTVQAATTPLPY